MALLSKEAQIVFQPIQVNVYPGFTAYIGESVPGAEVAIPNCTVMTTLGTTFYVDQAAFKATIQPFVAAIMAAKDTNSVLADVYAKTEEANRQQMEALLQGNLFGRDGIEIDGQKYSFAYPVVQQGIEAAMGFAQRVLDKLERDTLVYQKAQPEPKPLIPALDQQGALQPFVAGQLQVISSTRTGSVLRLTTEVVEQIAAGSTLLEAKARKQSADAVSDNRTDRPTYAPYAPYPRMDATLAA